MSVPVCKRCKCLDQAKCSHPYQYHFEISLRRFRGSTRTANHRLAERVAEKAYRDALELKTGIAPIKEVRFSRHIDDYCAHTEKANRTAYKDRRVLDRVLAVIGDRALTEITTFQIEKWKAKRANVVSKSTVNRELNIVRGCFSAAIKWDRLTVSPVKAVANYKVDDVRIRTLSEEEMRWVRDDMDDALAQLLCLATFETLARLSELLTLERHHIGPSWVEMRKKGGKVLRVTLPSKLRERLLLRAHPVSGFIFGEGEAGRPPTQQTASNRVLRALRELKIGDASHHTLRHTGVTVMLERGESGRVIQTLAGWTSLRMLERYGHVRNDAMMGAVSGNAEYLENLDTSDTATPTATRAEVTVFSAKTGTDNPNRIK